MRALPRLFVCLLLAVGAVVAAAQDTVPRAEAEARIQAMRARITALRKEQAVLYDGNEAAKVLSAAFDRHGAPKAKANHLSAWSGWLYLQYNYSGTFHTYHRDTLDTLLSNVRKVATVHRRHLDYLEEAMQEVEATHREISKTLYEIADSWAKEAALDEAKQPEAVVKAEDQRGKRAVAAIERLRFTRHMEAFKFDGPPPLGSGLRIGPISVDYAGWHVRRLELARRLEEAKSAVAAVNRIHGSQLDEVRVLQQDVLRKDAAEVSARGAVSAALAERASPLRVAVNDARYRRIEARLGQIDTRVATIEQRLPLAAVQAKAALVEEIRTLEGERRTLVGQKTAAETRLGITALRQRQNAAIESAESRHLEARKALARAISERNLKERLIAKTLEDHRAAVEAYDQAQRDASFLSPEAPLVTTVRAPRFSATLWNPSSDLERLKGEIAQVAAQRRYWEGKRSEYRQRLVAQAAAMEDKANRLIRWQRASMAAQFGVELLFTGGDILIKLKSGPHAALGEAYKKIVENVIWPPSYLDANNLVPEGHDLLDTLGTNAPKATKVIEKRFYKSAGTGTATNAIVASYLAAQAKEGYTELGLRMVRQSWLDGEEEFLYAVRRNFQVRPLLEEQAKNLREAEKKLAGATGFRSATKAAAKSFLTGLVKDVAKHEAKQAIANLFEGTEFWEYSNAQMELGATATLLLRSSNYYWQLTDLQLGLEALHREIVSQYDPTSGMKVSASPKVGLEEDLLIEVYNHESDPHRSSPLNVELRFGNVLADRLDGGRLIFRVPAAKLQAMEAKPQPVQIKVVG